MKKILPSAVRSETSNGHNGRVHGNGHASVGLNGSASSPVGHLEAQKLTALFVALAKQLLAVDDVAAELPLRQLRVCMSLYEGPRSMTALSRELGVSLSAMTQIADRLERARLVTRQLEGTDRRVRSLQLTSRGQRIMHLREEARVDRARQVIEQMSASEAEAVLLALSTLLH